MFCAGCPSRTRAAEQSQSSAMPAPLPRRTRDRIRLTGLAAISVGVALVLGWALTSAHPLWQLGLGIFALIVAAANLSLLRGG